jgi:alkylation response protein AidB-like acyl-CoA dehydrogenase
METETASDPALWSKIAEQGWNGIIFPEEYGGFGMGMVEMAVTLEEMGRALLPGPFFSTVLLAGTILDSAGSEAQKQKYLGAICRGEAKSTLAMLEADASWSPGLIKMEAPGSVLNGTKLFVTDAAAADFLIVAARMDGELALFVVAANAKGLSIHHTPSMDSTRKLYEVTFEGVAAELLAQGKPAEAALDRAFDIATVGLVAEMTGGMQRLLETTVEYAKTRKQFGRPIGQFQAVQHQCADMLLYSESSRSAAYYAAYGINEVTPDASLAVSVAKTYASDAYRETGNRAIQVHGGMGFTWENDAHLFYRRAKASELMLGDAAFHRERIAKLVVDHAGALKEEEVAVAVQLS